MIGFYINYNKSWCLNVLFIYYIYKSYLQNEEYYICIYAQRDCDVILFHHEGGVDIGNVDEKVLINLDYVLNNRVWKGFLRIQDFTQKWCKIDDLTAHGKRDSPKLSTGYM